MFVYVYMYMCIYCIYSLVKVVMMVMVIVMVVMMMMMMMMTNCGDIWGYNSINTSLTLGPYCFYTNMRSQ